MIAKFGQQIELIITDEADRVIMAPSGQESNIDLRVDFDLNHLDGFSRGTIKIWNLKPDMVREINSSNRFVTLNVKLHDGLWHSLANKWYISNSLEEIQLPNSITYLYCFDRLRLDLLEKQTTIRVKRPSLKNVIDTVVASVGFDLTKVDYKNFPEEVLRGYPDRNSRGWTGSVDGCIRQYSAPYRFNYYTVQDKLLLMYKPVMSNITLTDIPNTANVVTLDTSNMRSNPKIGVAQIKITSNLDPRLYPTTILDISKLLTAGIDAGEVATQLAEDFVSKSVGGYSKYQTLTTQHRGSNYAATWETILSAVSPDTGLSMPTVNWFR